MAHKPRVSNRAVNPGATPAMTVMPNLDDVGPAGLGGQTGQPTAPDRQQAFLNAAVDRHTTSSDRGMPPASPYVLQAGAVIAAALITGIRSDLPDQIRAQVTENIYDSPTGRILLVPQGTRIDDTPSVCWLWIGYTAFRWRTGLPGVSV